MYLYNNYGREGIKEVKLDQSIWYYAADWIR